MEQDLTLASTYLDRITNTPVVGPITSQAMTIAEEGKIRICYAPFDYVERKARIVIVGITPGQVQAINALTTAHTAMRQNKPVLDALIEAKLTASFSGPLRSNLVAMLDAIGIATYLGLDSTAWLFHPGSQEIHFTSALRYPVFVNGKNYNGTPDMLRTPILRHMIETHLAEEARLLPNALWLPLGPRVDKALQHLVGKGFLDPKRILNGLPHPSGANAERIAVFLGRKAPEKASRKTNPDTLLTAFHALKAKVSMQKGA
ncbi:hypothetical protein GCM10007972_17110 [Iodidimonas muriae]|uniref:Uracil DNA glycosylase superfamily protein n=1 Tax=Iodidimonas muriae TaxID=261467 RepID=A0ABQ2LDL0_9PROT|nr:hypothetical protein [Iodidimonas muriae]GER07813.1 hypothetical protein JCM17843_21230 [Kordiimonadales bacterium JCM 17843]GGO12306.1 hypothetical protein GCM10007972_17110 [Iodidimonas muriae]